VIQLEWLIRGELELDMSFINSQLPIVIASPSKDLSFSGQNCTEAVANCHFDDRNSKLNLEGQRIDFFNILLPILLIKRILLGNLGV